MSPPLPNASKKSPRVYRNLQTKDLEDVTFADMKATGDPLSIEMHNEDELRRLVMVNLARLTTSSEWTGLLTGGGGAGMTSFNVEGDSGTPETVTNGASLKFSGGTGLDTVVSSPDTITTNIANTGVTPNSYTSPSSVTVNAQGQVTAITAGSTPTDTTYTLEAAQSGTDVELQLDASAGTDSTVKLVAGSNITLTRTSSDSVTFDASGGGSGSTFNPVLPSTNPSSDLSLYMVYSMGLQTAVSGGFGTYGMSSVPRCWPFQSPVESTIDHISVDITNDGTGTMTIAIYDDDKGVPKNKLSGDMTYVAGTSGTGRLDLTPPTTTSLIQGRQYWIVIVESPSGNMTLRSRSVSANRAVLPVSKTSSNLLVSLPNSLNLAGGSSLPATISASNLSGNTDSVVPVWGIVYN
tara:strand:- start:3226 stop:4449 length:1224 start_codon:yes stop_codon:yes gene_type:complete